MARGIGLFSVSTSDDPDIAGGSCKTRCLQRGWQRTEASPRTLAISYSVSDSEGCFEVRSYRVLCRSRSGVSFDAVQRTLASFLGIFSK